MEKLGILNSSKDHSNIKYFYPTEAIHQREMLGGYGSEISVPSS